MGAPYRKGKPMAEENKEVAAADAKAQAATEKQMAANEKAAKDAGAVTTIEEALEVGYFGQMPDRNGIPENINEYSEEEARKKLYDKGQLP